MEKQEIIEIIANELIGVVPRHKGPFVSNAEARRIAHGDNKRRFEIAESIADALSIQPSGTVSENLNKPRPGDYYESEPEGDRINEETGKTWREQYQYDLEKWRQSTTPKVTEGRKEYDITQILIGYFGIGKVSLCQDASKAIAQLYKER